MVKGDNSNRMKYRELGRTGWGVSPISFGTWAIGSAWGDVEDKESLAALNRAVDLNLPPLSDKTMSAVRELYETRIRPLVHHYW